MTFWTLDRVADALTAVAVTPPPRGSRPLAAVSTDTRSVATGNLFVALRGERFDAHAFVRDAVEKGAAAVVVSDVTAAWLRTAAPARWAAMALASVRRASSVATSQ